MYIVLSQQLNLKGRDKIFSAIKVGSPMKALTRVYIYFTSRKRESKPVLNSKQMNNQTNKWKTREDSKKEKDKSTTKQRK